MPTCFAPAADSASVIKYPAKNGPFKIALVNGYVGNDWRSTTIQAAKAWGARSDNAKGLSEFKIISVGNDSAAQIAAIDNFIAAGYDGIVINAVNPTAFDAVVKRAKRAGTVLVTYDNVLDSNQIVQINEDQVELGRMKAQAVVDGIKQQKARSPDKCSRSRACRATALIVTITTECARCWTSTRTSRSFRS